MIIFTDGSFSTKPDIAGLGAVILIDDKEHRFGTYDNRCRDNNVAEIAAISMALQYVKHHKIDTRDDVKTITIISDSQCALNRISNRCKGNDEFESACLEQIFDFLDTSKKRVSFMQIKGHVHDGTKLAYYNNEADMLAGEYRQLGLELHYSNVGKKNKKAKKFWKNHGGNGGYGM